METKPASYAEAGMPNFPLPLSREGARVLTCAGLDYAHVLDFDDLRLLPRWKGYSIGDNWLTRHAQLIVDAVNNHERLTVENAKLREALKDGEALVRGAMRNFSPKLNPNGMALLDDACKGMLKALKS